MEHAKDPTASAERVALQPVAPHPVALEVELQLVYEAIAMVAGGAAPRVDVAGIAFAMELLDTARQLALESGVRARSILTDGEPTGISIERVAR